MKYFEITDELMEFLKAMTDLDSHEDNNVEYIVENGRELEQDDCDAVSYLISCLYDIHNEAKRLRRALQITFQLALMEQSDVVADNIKTFVMNYMKSRIEQLEF